MRAGSHQFQRPRIAISDGTRIMRMIVASSATANARPMPSSCSPATRPRTKPRNAATMIAAAAVTTRQGRPGPPAEDDDEESAGRRDREDVEEHRLQRQQQRPERAQEQEVRRRQHREDEPREVRVRALEEVASLRRRSADRYD